MGCGAVRGGLHNTARGGLAGRLGERAASLGPHLLARRPLHPRPHAPIYALVRLVPSLGGLYPGRLLTVAGLTCEGVGESRFTCWFLSQVKKVSDATHVVAIPPPNSGSAEVVPIEFLSKSKVGFGTAYVAGGLLT
jgi:hypothetical protein